MFLVVLLKKVDSKRRAIYSSIFMKREVNIYVTDDENLFKRAIIHRNNELMLNEFDNIFTLAIGYKLGGQKTEPAYCAALGIKDQDPYEFLLKPTSEIKKIARTREKTLCKLKKMIAG